MTKLQQNLPLRHFLQKTGGLHLKHIAPNYKTSIPPLKFNDDTYIKENVKANVLYNFVQSHTI